MCDNREVPPPELFVPDYAGDSTISIIPALTWGTPSPVVPEEVLDAPAVVVLLIDSLGWHQLGDNADVAPILTSLTGGPADTVAPTTTAAALTSISTGLPPGEHGLVGYRFPAGGSVLNALRWTAVGADHREAVSPRSVQTAPPFAGGSWTVLSHRAFAGSAFTEAYLGGSRYVGYHHPSSIVSDSRASVAAGERRTYAYYDGLDHVGHVYGVSGHHFRTELAFCDWLVGALIDALPTGTAVVVTADHGQIDAPTLVELPAEVDNLVGERSGEPRFRWLHSRSADTGLLLETASELLSDQAWVLSVDEVVDRGVLGPVVTDAARSRLGDVALIARSPVGFADPAEHHADRMVGRHGSLTEAELKVPVLTAVA